MVYCPLPWQTIFINNEGAQKFCCRSTINLPNSMDFNHAEIRKVRLQMLNNEIPESCGYCKEAEVSGGLSLRQDAWKNNVIPVEEFNSTDSYGVVSIPPRNYDLILGNTCNLKCMMCMPWCSSSWIEDWDVITQDLKIIDAPNSKDRSGKFRIYSQDCFDIPRIIESIKLSADHHETINVWFSGGEMMLTPMFKTILEDLQVYRDKLNISVLSNGTTLSPSMEDLLRSYPKLKMHYSIDGVGKKNDYIRYPSKFNVIEKNVKRMLDRTEKIYITVSAMNMFDIDEIVLWADNLGLKTHFEVVYGPITGFSPMAMPIRHRMIASKRLLNLSGKYLKNTSGEDIVALAESIRNNQRWSPDMRGFWKQIKKFDSLRGTDFLGTFETWKSFIR